LSDVAIVVIVYKWLVNKNPPPHICVPTDGLKRHTILDYSLFTVR